MAQYTFIPFPDTGPMVHRALRPAACHDRRQPGTWFGALHLRATCLQPVHVGSGFKAEQNGGIVRRSARTGARLGIPGSSFKGVIRSRFEAITRSCAFEPPSERDKVLSQTYRDVEQGRLTDDVKKLPLFDGRCGERELLCPACALFGFENSNGTLRSRISFADLTTEDDVAPETRDMPSQFGPRIHHLGKFRIDDSRGLREFVVGPLHGRKFYVDSAVREPAVGHERVEAMASGTHLLGTIQLFNVETAELGALLVALGVAPASFLKVGAGKGHGFGRIRLDAMTYRLRDDRRRSKEPDVAGYSAAFEASHDRWDAGVQKLLEIHGARN